MNTGFVFLEITQPEIRALLWHMQWILSGTEPRHSVHVTLRGPYTGRIASKTVKKSSETLRNDTLRIGGVGRLRQPEEVVFLRVDCPNLRKVWWKPDFPKKSGYEPHISLYRGDDTAFADRVANYLVRESLELSCADFRLAVHRRAGLPLASSKEWTVDNGKSGTSFGHGRTEPQFLARLRRFVDEYRAAAASAACAHIHAE